MLFVDGVIDILDELGNDFVDAVILVGGFLGGAGNDQRRARFVDQDGVDFVDDAEVMAALDAIGEIVLHVVAQIIEAEFVVGAVGDVGGVGVAALHVVEIVNDDADGEAEHFVDGAHPFGVASGEVIVDGDDVDAASGERVQICGKGGDQRFSFAGFHLGDFAFVQNHAADQLHVEMAHVELAAADFADEGERGHENGCERFLHFGAVFGIFYVDALQLRRDLHLQFGGLNAEVLVGELLHFRLERVDLRDERLELLDVALVLRPDEKRNYIFNKPIGIHAFVLDACFRASVASLSYGRSFIVIQGAAQSAGNLHWTFPSAARGRCRVYSNLFARCGAKRGIALIPND